MAELTDQKEFVNYVVELMQGIGPVYHKRMFGGYGIFLEGLMLGLIADNELYLKADDQNSEDFQALDLEPFVYNKQGKPMRMSYYQAPEQALEDSETMIQWAASAYQAAVRAAQRKSPRKRK